MFPTITSNVYTHLKLEDAQREMERLERVEKEMKKCTYPSIKSHILPYLGK